tara:strand:+ start:17256 stop:17558 length:303 start_codon:yes stop_codon:yes gene_type:complete
MMTSRFKEKKVRSKKHLDRVRSLPCLVCFHPPRSHAHHIQFSEERGFGQKVGDQYTVPLCGMCHHKLHTCRDGERLFWVLEGVDALKEAEHLWRETNAET